jgi:two-component system response regulator AtoC
MKSLMAYDWPGNVRELENCIERAVALGDQRCIEVADLPASIAGIGVQAQAETSDLYDLTSPTNDLEDLERVTIQRVFAQVNGDKARAGKMLGISRATLYRKLKRYNIGAREETQGSTTLQ